MHALFGYEIIAQRVILNEKTILDTARCIHAALDGCSTPRRHGCRRSLRRGNNNYIANFHLEVYFYSRHWSMRPPVCSQTYRNHSFLQKCTFWSLTFCSSKPQSFPHLSIFLQFFRHTPPLLLSLQDLAHTIPESDSPRCSPVAGMLPPRCRYSPQYVSLAFSVSRSPWFFARLLHNRKVHLHKILYTLVYDATQTVYKIGEQSFNNDPVFFWPAMVFSSVSGPATLCAITS